MKRWEDRPKEVAHLLNPAFCARILYSTVAEYSKTTKRAMPFPLVYLILPLILHTATRKLISSKTQMLVWIQKYPELLIDFSRRCRDLVPIANESLELLIHTGYIIVTPSGELELVGQKKKLSKTRFTDKEVQECLKKSEHIAKWFAVTGKVETIYISLGVKP